MIPLEPILRALDFTEAHLQAPINVASMAEAASYSLYHFCRSFRRVTHHTPYDYLMRRRITLAAHDLMYTEQKIIDIAFQYQFESHEGFTRAFQRMIGLSPSEARRLQSVPLSGNLPPLTEAHLTLLARSNGLPPEFVPLPGDDLPHETTFDLAAIADWLPHVTRAGRTLLTLPPLEQGIPDDRLARNYAAFCLTPPLEDLPLLLDWILHVWLFYAPYGLCQPRLLIETTAETLTVYVPAQRRNSH